jgi:hypothetical protein
LPSSDFSSSSGGTRLIVLAHERCQSSTAMDIFFSVTFTVRPFCDVADPDPTPQQRPDPDQITIKKFDIFAQYFV